MNVLPLFSIKDAAGETFTLPFGRLTDAQAIREFRVTVNTEGHEYNQCPEDYTLWLVGSFATATAELVPANPPVCIAHGHDVLEKL